MWSGFSVDKNTADLWINMSNMESVCGKMCYICSRAKDICVGRLVQSH